MAEEYRKQKEAWRKKESELHSVVRDLHISYLNCYTIMVDLLTCMRAFLFAGLLLYHSIRPAVDFPFICLFVCLFACLLANLLAWFVCLLAYKLELFYHNLNFSLNFLKIKELQVQVEDTEIERTRLEQECNWLKGHLHNGTKVSAHIFDSSSEGDKTLDTTEEDKEGNSLRGIVILSVKHVENLVMLPLFYMYMTTLETPTDHAREYI